MTFTIENMKQEWLDRGIITRNEVEAHTAIVKFDNGDWMGVSRYVDEDHWIVDCAFRANGFPVFSNGTGSRVTAGRTFDPESGVPEALDNAQESYYEERGSAEADAAYEADRDMWSRYHQEEALGRPLFPNEY